MRLEFRILWFEDQPTNIKPFENTIRSGLARLGFEPVIDSRVVVSGGNDPMANLPAQQDVDLVLMDWRLGGGHDGAHLAKRVRAIFRNTDIIFYSSEAPKKLREIIFNQDIDGVYCCNRESLTDRTMGIIKAQVRKVMDLNHMRGIVMAATSDLDHAITECLEMVQKLAYPDSAASFAESIGSQVAKSLRSKADDIEKLGRKGRLDKLLREPTFAASMRLDALRVELQKIEEKISETHLLEQLGRYQDEVIRPRNDFAHRRATSRDGKLMLEGRTEPFDQEGMTALRLRLLGHADNLRALLSLLREMALAIGDSELAGRLGAVERAVEQVGDAHTTDG